MAYLPPARPLSIFDSYLGREREHYLAVVNERDSQKVRGVSAPNQHHSTPGGSDWRIRVGLPGNERRVTAKALRTPLVKALSTRYRGDAHALAYHLRAGGMGLEKQPRINKTDGGMEWVLRQGIDAIFDVALLDLDNPLVPNTKPARKHPNDAASIEEWKRQFARPALAFAGKFITKNGARLVVPFAVAIYDREQYEGCVRAVTQYVNELGWTSMGQAVSVDSACSDFSRLYRLPHGVRSGTSAVYESPWVDLSTMEPRDFAPICAVSVGRVRADQKPRPAAPAAFTPTAPERYIPNVSPSTLAALVPGATRHQSLSSTACMLLVKGVPPEVVPAVVVEAARRMGVESSHFHGDREYAQRTVSLWCKEHETHLTGASWLYRNCRPLAEAIDAISLGFAADALALVGAQYVSRASADIIYKSILSDTRDAFGKDGVTVFAHPCGTGKTDAATEIALEVATGLHPSGRSGKALIYATRTAYVAPQQKNARDYQRRAWEKRRLPVVRLTSPLSERYEAGEVDGFGASLEGEPVCVFHAEVVALCSGGQNAKRLFCDGAGGEPCSYRSTCRAATGAVDHNNQPIGPGTKDEHPHICLTHARISVALDHVGKNGKVICDERPSLCEVFTLTAKRIKETLDCLPSFEDGYAGRMSIVLQALRGALQSLEPYEAVGMVETLGQVVVEEARAAFPDDSFRSGAPPMRPQTVAVARSRLKTAKILGEASEVLWVVWRLLQPNAEEATLRVVLSQFGERELHIAWTDRSVAALLSRADGATVVYDADAHLWEPEYRAIIRSDHVPIISAYAEDGSRIDRRIILTRLGSKGSVTEKGKFKPGLKHLDLVRLAVERAAGHRAGVLVTWKALALIIRAALGVDVAADWQDIDQEPAYLAPLAAEMRIALAPLPWLSPLDVLHYGAVRGDDSHRVKPLAVTIGDPIPNIHAVETMAGHLKVDGATLGVRQARAELGQAQERIRTHRRSSPATAIHLGRGAAGDEPVYPDGWEGTRFAVEEVGGGIGDKIRAGLLGSIARLGSVRPANDVERATG